MSDNMLKNKPICMKFVYVVRSKMLNKIIKCELVALNLD